MKNIKEEPEFEYEDGSCVLLNTNFIDDLRKEGLVSETGEIQQIIPKYKGRMEVSTKLLQMIMKIELDKTQWMK